MKDGALLEMLAHLDVLDRVQQNGAELFDAAADGGGKDVVVLVAEKAVEVEHEQRLHRRERADLAVGGNSERVDQVVRGLPAKTVGNRRRDVAGLQHVLNAVDRLVQVVRKVGRADAAQPVGNLDVQSRVGGRRLVLCAGHRFEARIREKHPLGEIGRARGAFRLNVRMEFPHGQLEHAGIGWQRSRHGLVVAVPRVDSNIVNVCVFQIRLVHPQAVQRVKMTFGGMFIADYMLFDVR